MVYGVVEVVEVVVVAVVVVTLKTLLTCVLCGDWAMERANPWVQASLNVSSRTRVNEYWPIKVSMRGYPNEQDGFASTSPGIKPDNQT